MTQTFATILNTMSQVILLTVPMAGLLLFFFWTLFQLILSVNDPEKKKEAKGRLMWSIFAFFMVLALQGIIVILQMTLFGQSNQK